MPPDQRQARQVALAFAVWSALISLLFLVQGQEHFLRKLVSRWQAM